MGHELVKINVISGLKKTGMEAFCILATNGANVARMKHNLVKISVIGGL
jgi:hypothetical protein